MGQTDAHRILLVDDDADAIAFVAVLLSQGGYHLHTAPGGVRGLEIAASVPLDLILLDIRMPAPDGFETCRRLKAHPATREVPVIFLSGARDDDSVVQGLELGAVDYVTKPVEPDVLLARVRNHVLLGRLTRSLQGEVAARTAELERRNASLRRLSAQLSIIEQRERQRLAAGLHDGPLQHLMLAKLRLQAPVAGADPADVLVLLDEAITDLRGLLFDLSPPQLHDVGLAAALDELASRTAGLWGLPVHFHAGSGLDRVCREHAVVAFQAARELATNAAKHASARFVLIAADFRRGRLRLSVLDDGRGLPARRAEGEVPGSGFGLRSLRQRLEAFGGSLTLDPMEPGTRATMILPTGD
jgi:signal transduction histidine kinase